jgi:hypothetical protein
MQNAWRRFVDDEVLRERHKEAKGIDALEAQGEVAPRPCQCNLTITAGKYQPLCPYFGVRAGKSDF